MHNGGERVGLVVRASVALVVVSTLAMAVACSAPDGSSRVQTEDVPVGDGSPASAPVATPPPLPTPRHDRSVDTVLLVGDSGMVDAAVAIDASFTSAGVREVIRAAVPGYGLTRAVAPGALPAWVTDWPKLIAEHDPDLTIVHLGGWDYDWIAAHGTDAYAELVRQAAAALSARGGSVLWLQMLPDDDPRAQQVDEAVSRLTESFPGQVYGLDVGGVLASADGTFPQNYVGADGELVRLRKPDGWHLCQDGAIRVALAVHLWSSALFDVPDVVTGWERGPWWDDAAFDNPGCWPRGAWATR